MKVVYAFCAFTSSVLAAVYLFSGDYQKATFDLVMAFGMCQFLRDEDQ